MIKLTDEETIQILERCSKMSSDGCGDCPLKRDGCAETLIKYAFDLVNRQKADVEMWQEKYYELANIKNDEFSVVIKEYNKTNALRAEAIKEFVERLREETEQNTFDNGYVYSGTLDVILDNLAKEMVGDNNE